MPQTSTILTLSETETEEIDPVQLLWESNLDRATFAQLLGVAKQTVDTWCAGIYAPNRQCRRLAAEIRNRWQREGKI